MSVVKHRNLVLDLVNTVSDGLRSVLLRPENLKKEPWSNVPSVDLYDGLMRNYHMWETGLTLVGKRKRILNVMAFAAMIYDNLGTEMETRGFPVGTFYYAHSKLIYGTERERDELGWLRSKFEKVVDPNTDIGERGAIEPYLAYVRGSAGVVASEVDGFVGKGVYHEVVECGGTIPEIPCSVDPLGGRPVFCLRSDDDDFYLLPVTGILLHDSTDWKRRYAVLVVDENGVIR